MKYETLGNIVEVSKGRKHNPSETPNLKSKRIIGINDLRNDATLVYTDDKYGVEADEKDVLIAWDGANAGTIGYGKKGYIGSTISRLRIKNPKAYFATFLGKLLQSKFEFLRSTSTGATIPHINRVALDSIKVPQFEISDQIRIATVLAQAEKLIAKRRESIKALDELLKSTFLEMFGLNNADYKKWKLEPLSSNTEIVSGVTKGKKYKDNVLREVPYMRVANVQDGHLNLTEIKTIEVTENEIQQYRLQKGDLLLTEGGDPDKLGRGAVWNNEIKECIHQNHIFRVRVKNMSINPVFLSALMASKYGKSYFLKAAKQTTGIASINSKQLKAFPLIKPPLPLQNQFAVIVSKVESLKSKYTASLTELENLYGSLSQRAFKGELDLSNVPVEPKVESEIVKTQKDEPKFEEDVIELFSDDDIVSAIKKILQTPMTFEKLYEKLIDELDVNLESEFPMQKLDYRKVKEIVFKQLEGDFSLLSQFFDEKEKTIVLRIKE